MHTFEQQDTTQTLAEGLAEYYRDNPGLARLRTMSAGGREFFRCHDAVHVVYGCGTSLEHEAIVKLASVFGTTGGLGVLKGYGLHESVEIYRKLRPAEIGATVLSSFVLVPRTVYRCLLQRSRWPWSDFAPYEHLPLNRIRSVFGIRVARH
ncbi:MAG: hypothetical protein HY854_16565 [Burkholderiales bacterium]|nr:hypothetical protein [Burkholderiales bacterium]